MPLSSGKLIPIVCENKDQCFLWRGPAVVIDVLRFSTTLCALLTTGKQDIRIYSSKEKAVEYKDTTPNVEFFSELDFIPPFEKFDNSPHIALTQSNPKRTAVMVTNSGTKALMALSKASNIFVGCFANFSAVIKMINNFSQEVLLVPAGIFDAPNIEDVACAQSLQDGAFGKTDAPFSAIEKIRKSTRLEDFLRGCPKTGQQDLELALSVDKLNVLGSAEIVNNYAVVKKSPYEK